MNYLAVKFHLKIIVTLFFIGSSYRSTCQSFDWLKSASFLPGTLDNVYAAQTTVDSDANLYMTLHSQGGINANMDGGFYPFANVDYVRQVFILKHDYNGAFVWAKSIRGIPDSSGNALTYDILVSSLDHSVYISGIFQGVLDFDPGPAEFLMTSVDYGNNAFILKLSSEGDFEWAYQFGSTSIDEVKELAEDSFGNILITGAFMGTVDFDPGAGEVAYSALTSSSGFLLKLDSAGNFIWVKVFEGDKIALNQLTLDETGDIFVQGVFYADVDTDPDLPEVIYTGSYSDASFFVEKLNDAGEFQWVKVIEGTPSSWMNVYGLEVKDDYLYLLGTFRRSTDFDPSPSVSELSFVEDVTATFIQKLDTEGNFIWAKGIGGDGTVAGYELKMDPFDDLFICGAFKTGSADFDPGPETYMLETVVGDPLDFYLLKLDSDGNFLWTETSNTGTKELFRDVTIDESGNVYVVGDGVGCTADFNFGFGLATLPNEDRYFALKLSYCDPVTIPVSIHACNAYTTPSGDTTYYESGFYRDTLMSSTFCDSILLISLTIGDVEASLAIDGYELTAFPSGATYQWLVCGTTDLVEIPGATDQVYNAPTIGSYAVIVNDDGCIDTTECFSVLGNADVENFNQNFDLKVFPNPSTGNVTIVCTENANVSIYSTLGEVVGKTSILAGSTELDLRGLASGIYHMQIYTRNGVVFSRKLVIQEN